MKYLSIWIAVIFSISGSLAQSVSTSETPSQSGFEAGVVQVTPTTETPSQGAFGVDLNQTYTIPQTASQGGFEAGVAQVTPTTETPSQGAFAIGVNQTTSTGAPFSQASAPVSSTAGSVAISKVINESGALHVIVANNGTASANLTSWKLELNNGTSTYVFPSFMLKPAAVVTVHAHKNVNSPTDLYGSNFMWNGTSDVELIDSAGKTVSEYGLYK